MFSSLKNWLGAWSCGPWVPNNTRTFICTALQHAEKLTSEKDFISVGWRSGLCAIFSVPGSHHEWRQVVQCYSVCVQTSTVKYMTDYYKDARVEWVSFSRSSVSLQDDQWTQMCCAVGPVYHDLWCFCVLEVISFFFLFKRCAANSSDIHVNHTFVSTRGFGVKTVDSFLFMRPHTLLQGRQNKQL